MLTKIAVADAVPMSFEKHSTAATSTEKAVHHLKRRDTSPSAEYHSGWQRQIGTVILFENWSRAILLKTLG